VIYTGKLKTSFSLRTRTKQNCTFSSPSLNTKTIDSLIKINQITE